jgi:hypothetical protein
MWRETLWALVLGSRCARDLGAAGPLRDRDRSRGTARFPAAVTTAC